ncbi:hypothetical protein [Hymenobacter arizonensis]|uniref:Uncharacterized protein n=1 Tax=Hymenobacter arizonensis TaxID=1227077 RepID=A0A1I6BCF7_HYMAR|nr:hypothetical protein [Hymenobacter arizonensis]SFQ78635.1 hypothetical protein SAMN04515668_4346 [Hymenobacter arizonensis]
MNYYDYLFYGLYRLFVRLNRNVLPEVDAFLLLALNLFCLGLTLLFMSGQLFLVLPRLYQSLLVFPALAAFNYFYFIHRDQYLARVARIGALRAGKGTWDTAFTLCWTLACYLTILFYVYLAY